MLTTNFWLTVSTKPVPKGQTDKSDKMNQCPFTHGDESQVGYDQIDSNSQFSFDCNVSVNGCVISWQDADHCQLNDLLHQSCGTILRFINLELSH